MAVFNGTQGADTISGTIDDDIIFGLGGMDVINGAGGNDEITGGADADDILGGSGDDTLIIDETAEALNDSLDGGDGTDTVVTGLLSGDDLSNAGSATLAGGTIWGQAVQLANLEMIQVSNASDLMLTVGEDAVFAFDQMVSSDNFSNSGDTDLEGSDITGGFVSTDSITFDETAGIVIGGMTYADGDSFTTAGGGTVEVDFDGTRWELDYTHPGDGALTLAVADTDTDGERTVDEVLNVVATDDEGNEINIEVTLDYGFGSTIDLQSAGVDSGVRVVGSDNSNSLFSGDGDDTIIGNGGSDAIFLYEGNNTVWAGPTDDDGDDIYVYGDGNNVAGGAAGNDDFYDYGGGNNTFYGGADNDDLNIYGGSTTDGDTTFWAGEGDDDAYQYGDGNAILGGGVGEDEIYIYGDGGNIAYLGADDDDDFLGIYGDGNNTVFGGVGEDGTGENFIGIYGGGDNEVFNGNGDDYVYVDDFATGSNALWGGVGDDFFDFNNDGASATIVFVEGNGNDTIRSDGSDNFIDEAAQQVDLSSLGFTDTADVINSMTETAGHSTIFVAPGQTITFEDITIVEFQAADPADWLIL